MSGTPDEQERKDGDPPRLRRLSVQGNIVGWSVVGIVLCTVGLLLLTGLASSPWLFLLYPLLIGGLLVSLGALALHLLRGL
jgi:hypothetical protein